MVAAEHFDTVAQMTEILTPDEVRKRFGTLFCQGIFTIVDEVRGVAQVIEHCIAKGPMEWDAVNRRRAGGIIEDIRIEGHSLIMDTIIGEREVSFGPVSKDVGGQGLKALQVHGETVKTTWVGLAGATVGIGACIPQGCGVLKAEYPDGFKIGGAHRLEVKITTPKLVRMVIGVDDTDTKESGASWAMVLKLARECPIGHFLDHKIIQLNPKAPNKTTNCCSTGVSFAVLPSEAEALKEWMVEGLSRETLSDETTMVVYTGLRMPQALVDWSWDAKSVLYCIDEAKQMASDHGLELIKITGIEGAIGAVAAVGCFDLGLRAAGLREDFEG